MTRFLDVVYLIHSTKKRKQLEGLLYGLTTPHEQKIISMRLEVVKRLINGQTQHEIAADLHVGVATVTRWARELDKGRFRILENKKVNR